MSSATRASRTNAQNRSTSAGAGDESNSARTGRTFQTLPAPAPAMFRVAAGGVAGEAAGAVAGAVVDVSAKASRAAAADANAVLPRARSCRRVIRGFIEGYSSGRIKASG